MKRFKTVSFLKCVLVFLIDIVCVSDACVRISGVQNRFQDYYFTKGEYQQLVYQALAGLPGLEIVPPSELIHTLPPAIMKPVQRWTGKQVCHRLLTFDVGFALLRHLLPL